MFPDFLLTKNTLFADPKWHIIEGTCKATKNEKQLIHGNKIKPHSSPLFTVFVVEFRISAWMKKISFARQIFNDHGDPEISSKAVFSAVMLVTRT